MRGLALLIVSSLFLFGGMLGCGGEDEGGDSDQVAQPEGTQGGDPEPEPPAPDQGEFSDGNASAGEEVFAEHCATCHGAEGGGATAGPSLTDPRIAGDEQQALEQVVNGGGGMPPFEGVLSDQEIADVVAYVVEDLAGQSGEGGSGS